MSSSHAQRDSSPSACVDKLDPRLSSRVGCTYCCDGSLLQARFRTRLELKGFGVDVEAIYHHRIHEAALQNTHTLTVEAQGSFLMIDILLCDAQMMFVYTPKVSLVRARHEVSPFGSD